MTGIHNHGAFIALHQVATARSVKNENGQEMAYLTMIDGRRVVDVTTWDKFNETVVQLIPSESGTCLLHAWTDGDEPDNWIVGRTPLIAWALCLDGEIRPVTASGVNDGCCEPDDIGNFVEMPTGQVVSTSPWAGRAGFDDAKQFFADALEVRGKQPGKALEA